MGESNCISVSASFAKCFVPHKERGRLVVLEGSPCAGKTTTLSQLKKCYDGIVVPELDHTGEAHLLTVGQIQSWYLVAEIDRQPVIQQGLMQSRTVFQDRNVLGTLAFSYASARLSRSHAPFTRLLNRTLKDANRRLVRPDILVALYVDEAVGLDRRRRLSGEPLDPIWADLDFLRYHAEFYRAAIPLFPADTLVVLDTTNLTPEETANVVEQRVRRALFR